MSIINWILLFIILIVAGVLVYFLVFKKNKYLVRIRLLTGTKRLILDDIGIEWKDEKKVSYMKLKKQKELIPMPPKDAIELSKTGKKLVEVYRDERGNYSYIKDNANIGFKDPIETNQRILLADQTIKAHSKKTGIMQYLPMIVGLGFVIVIVLGGMMMIGEPLKSMSDFTASVAAPTLEAKRLDESIINKLIELDNNIQMIKSQTGTPEYITPPN